MSKNTPGPWEIREGDIWRKGGKSRADLIANISLAYKASDTFEANAHLIAAAPQLKAALEEIENHCANTNNLKGAEHAAEGQRIREQMRAALKAADGETGDG